MKADIWLGCREVARVLAEMCNKVNEGQALGPLCKEVCMKNTLQPRGCQAWHAGKEIVFRALFHGNPVFVKG